LSLLARSKHTQKKRLRVHVYRKRMWPLGDVLLGSRCVCMCPCVCAEMRGHSRTRLLRVRSGELKLAALATQACVKESVTLKSPEKKICGK
jgi:hypothetical protein